MLKDKILERDEATFGGLESSQSAPIAREPSAAPEKPVPVVTARAPAPREMPAAEAPAAPVQADEPPAAGDKRKVGFLSRRPIVSAIGAALLASLLGGGYLYIDYAGHFQSTDDAFIAARQSSLAPKVSGYIAAVPVTDNQHVEAGDVIARIDDRDYRTALEQAEAQVAAAQATIASIDAQLKTQAAQIDANQAQVDQAQAALVFAQQQAARYDRLAQTGYGSVQNGQQYDSQFRQQQAALASAEATLRLAQRQIETLKAQRGSAVASLAQFEAQRDQAKLNLSYTTVVAAQAGRVVSLTAAVGQFVEPGASLSMFVPDQIWVTANFKEIQLDQMRSGDAATLAIDAYPEREIRGHVDSVQSGSGTAFSLLPAQNATGNYVKIVQRVPVKIVMDNPPADVALGPGMSVVPTVRIDATPSLIETLKRRL
jgi:membrane fusion protein, multidrug efflux system